MDTTVADPVVGLTLDGRYHVDSRIAQGGMATVYLGRDIRLDRTVALKVMHPSLASDEDFVRRFIGEAKSVARLSHPNVVAVYDQGTDQNRVYLAMEYVPGRTLRDLLRERGRLAPRAALELLAPVLAALGAAHRAGLIHRDVKPENVLLTDDGRVKVVDFGLARAVESTHHTKTGLIIGTVAYLAPEQVVRGTSDARTDVYAAGIMLFELLTGRQPHTGDTPLSVAYKHVNEVVPPPSSVVPGLPPALDALVAMATSRDPDLRPADAGQFLQAVYEALRSLPPDPAFPSPDGAATAVPTVSVPGHPDAGRTQVVQHPAGHTLVVPVGLPTPDRDARGRDRLRRRWLTSRPTTVIGFTLAVVLVLVGVGWWLMMGRWTDTPDLRGMTLAAAVSKARSEGFRVRVGAPRFDDQVPQGRVLTTDPPPGSKMHPHGVITLIVSKGSPTAPVPDVTGTSLDDARQALRAAGLTPGTVVHRFDATVPRGAVISTDPPAGQQVARTQGITLTVSNGIQVPDVRNLGLADAQARLSRLGFNTAVTQRNSDAPPDTVIAQTPTPGTGANQGAVIRLVVSAGPQMVPVPDVTGWDVKDAVKALRDAGFKVRVNRIFGGRQVQTYNPSGQAPQGSTITIWAFG